MGKCRSVSRSMNKDLVQISRLDLMMHCAFLWHCMIATIWSNEIWPMPMGLHASPATDLACLISHETLCSSEAVLMVSFSNYLFLDVRFNCQGRYLYISTLMFPKASRSHIPKRPRGRSIPFRPTVPLAPPHRGSRGSSPRQ